MMENDNYIDIAGPSTTTTRATLSASTLNASSDGDLPLCQSYSDVHESYERARNGNESQTIKSSFMTWFYRQWFDEDHQFRGDGGGQVLVDSGSNISASPTTTTTTTATHRNNLWPLNYCEAGIYLMEGRNNDKFEYHPHIFHQLPAYLAVHNHLYYQLDLFGCMLLLSLALCERPAKYAFPEWAHASLELFGLSIIGLVLLAKYNWSGARYFRRHGRTLLKTIVLLLMIIEALVVLVRQDSHFRVTRALRPFFLVDNYYFNGVRRVIRQMLQSLPAFLYMLALLGFILVFFSISAFYLFSPIENYAQFSTLGRSMISLFVLLTTANFPDVMMPAYNRHAFYALFFIVFLVINLYYLLNIMLALVYQAFSQIEKHKFRKLFMHRRWACTHAFRLLVSATHPRSITFERFNGLVEYLKPESTPLDRYLMFKSLVNEDFKQELVVPKKTREARREATTITTTDVDANFEPLLTLDKFFHIYEVLDLQWKLGGNTLPWYNSLENQNIRMLLFGLRRVLSSPIFSRLMYGLIIVASFYQLLDALFDSSKWLSPIEARYAWLPPAIFITLYTIEMCLKLLAFGPSDYFRVRWNLFDALVTILSLVTIVFKHYFVTLSLTFYSFRSLRLLDLLRSTVGPYRDILGPFSFIIIKRFISVSIVVSIVYYAFAILAMECFGGYDLANCCVNSSVEVYFRSDNTSAAKFYYYLNNFNNLPTSYVTLFELMVVNNWQVLMTAYVIVTGSQWTSIFFVLFYITSLVVITIVIAFVLDTFHFHIQYKHRFGDDDLSVKIQIKVCLSQSEAQYFEQKRSIRGHHTLVRWPASLITRLASGGNQRRPDTIVINVGEPEFATMETPNIAPPFPDYHHHVQGTETTTTPATCFQFLGTKLRDKFGYNIRMYSEEISHWVEDMENESQ